MGTHPSLVALAVLSLAVGPALSWAWPARQGWRSFLDGLSLTLVGGLCLLHLAPHAITEGGLLAMAAGTAGFLGPALVHRVHRGGAWIWVTLGAAAVAVHSFLDGASLGVTGGAGAAIALAVAAHQLPVGLGIWTLTGGSSGGARASARGWAAIGAVMVATLAGVAFGGALELPAAVEGALEALVAGALLHVVFDAADPDHAHTPPPAPARGATPALRVLGPGPAAHGFVRATTAPVPLAPVHGHHACRDHGHDHGHDGAAQRAWSSVGAVLGVVAIAALSRGGDAVGHLGATFAMFLRLASGGAPALVAGYALAALAAAFLPEPPTGWLTSGGRLAQAAKGVGFGVPLPVCACGVLPLYGSLVRRGVPATAAVAFLVATPALGPDTVLLSIPLLGAPFALARVGGAAAVAAAVALLVGHADAHPLPARRAEAPGPRPRLAERLRSGLRFGGVELVDHTLPWVVLGLLLAALSEPLLDHDVLASVPAALQVPLLTVLGLPLYVCASGAMPVAALAVHKGVSAGAALAFLVAGPATNVATFGVLARLHGRGPALRFGMAVVGAAVLLGWTVDLLGVPVAPVAHATSDSAPADPVGSAALLVLAALGTLSLFRQGARGVVAQILEPIHR